MKVENQSRLFQNEVRNSAAQPLLPAQWQNNGAAAEQENGRAVMSSAAFSPLLQGNK